MKLIDRIDHAAELCRGKRILDIGGQKMPYCDPKSPFARRYRRIGETAREHRVVDVQNAPGVDHVLDLNVPESVDALAGIIAEYRPEVILCMETLEHVNTHFEVMNLVARAVSDYGAAAFITLPNNGNWVINAMGWNHDHCIAFFRDIAERFVRRSDLGRHEITMHACIGRYLWYWWIVYLLAFCQPVSWGFTVRPTTEARRHGAAFAGRLRRAEEEVA
jgi:hypothetical protein